MATLQEVEKEDNYQTLCARSRCNRDARRECIYEAWNTQEEAVFIKNNFLLPAGVKVVIMNPTADGGMPHTRAGKLICLPAYSTENQEKLKETIRHELVHIDQVRRPGEWREYLLKEGWTAFNEDRPLPQYVKERLRINPDTLGAKYLWEGRYLPCPLYEREDKPRLNEIEVRWWDVKEEKLHPFTPTSFTKKYGTNVSESSKEHPFELYAYRNE